MKYRKFGELEWKPSALGFGMMRLPTVKEGYSATIDREQATNMAHYAFDHGLNYVDTAWPYHSGTSEQFVADVLEDYRDQARLATKMPSWVLEKHEGLDFYLGKQLEILKTDHIDFYLLHGLNKKRWETYQEIDVFSWIDKVLDEGKIHNIGYSFHDSFKVFKDIVDAYDWDFCQIQYNFLDEHYQAGRKGLQYAAEKGMGVVIMEPLRGGLLAREPPDSVKRVMNQAEVDWSPVEWALRWVWNHPEVSVVLSGMSAIEHVKENVEIADRAGDGRSALTDDQLDVMTEIQSIYEDLYPVDCTGCNYCLPCPNDVAIPYLFDLYNIAEVYDQFEEKQKRYNKLDEEKRASACIACRQCVDKCPQHLPIPGLLKDVAAYFERD
ncbi:MAG: aldo/keto reductase [Candidatus Korarchaeota archaeon]|nr:aldo/keto reductase [Candidatus Korarchaeota archaeon]NIU82256.1 4Fe-4S dicluster domain-containing protein [Candidatus Thorarchaeota archaeon]NIW12707.1 4Fe-4S dicluster domain-containing protein [Candidatus Thorarchaeota archaeon]NIW50920.1 4Fe-4S dicluster domain-containing protein [Candidatus Korarchaeota archaeon]